MPKLDLLNATALKVAGGNVIALKGDGYSWAAAPVPGGPIRTPTADTGNVVYGGNSSLFAAMDAHSSAWSSGSFSIDPGQSSEEVWDADGDARNGTYAYLHLSEIDDYTGSGYADPDSAQGITNLQHLYWLGLEAVDRGAHLFLFTSPSHRTIDNDAHNREVMNYYRWWLQDKLSVPVWVTDAPRIVRNLEATYGAGDSAIYADDLHYTAMTGRAFGWALYAQVTGDTPAGAEATDAVAYAAVWDMLDNYWWAGFGGTEGGDMWVGADPLPSPDPRPTPAAYRVLWTADGYDGPTLTGDQPTATGNVMAFDGSGLRNDGGFALTNGMYQCCAIRFPSVPSSDIAINFANTDPADIFAEPYCSFEANGSTYTSSYWNSSNTGQYQGTPDTSWHIVETWQIGDQVGICIDGATDGTATAFEAIAATDSLCLFGGGQALESVYLEIRDVMPDSTERAAIRAAAEALIPTDYDTAALAYYEAGDPILGSDSEVTGLELRGTAGWTMTVEGTGSPNLITNTSGGIVFGSGRYLRVNGVSPDLADGYILIVDVTFSDASGTGQAANFSGVTLRRASSSLQYVVPGWTPSNAQTIGAIAPPQRVVMAVNLDQVGDNVEYWDEIAGVVADRAATLTSLAPTDFRMGQGMAGIIHRMAIIPRPAGGALSVTFEQVLSDFLEGA